MYYVVNGLPAVNYPNVCTSAPVHKKAFCKEHLDFLSAKHPSVPTDIHVFKHCGVLKDNDRPEGKCIQLYVLIFINQNILKAYGENEINFTY